MKMSSISIMNKILHLSIMRGQKRARSVWDRIFSAEEPATETIVTEPAPESGGFVSSETTE